MAKQFPTGGASTVVDEMDLLTRVDRAALTLRISTISVPPDTDPPLSSYYNDAGIIAVTGYNSSKRHFCYLLGGIPFADIPDPGMHQVYEFHFNELKENRLKDWEKLPTGLPKRVDGFAMLGVLNQPPSAKPSTVSLLTDEFPEGSKEGTRFFGSSEGGMYVTPKGNIELVSAGGRSIKFGKNIDYAESTALGTTGGKDSLLLMQNPLHNGETMGAPVAAVLPLAVATHNPTLNLPAIAETYVKVNGYKQMVTKIKELTETGSTLA